MNNYNETKDKWTGRKTIGNVLTMRTYRLLDLYNLGEEVENLITKEVEKRQKEQQALFFYDKNNGSNCDKY